MKFATSYLITTNVQLFGGQRKNYPSREIFLITVSDMLRREKNLIKNKQDEFDIGDYYSTKNKVIRMISVVLVLAIMAGVVLGVDAVMAIIKGFFS